MITLYVHRPTGFAIVETNGLASIDVVNENGDYISITIDPALVGDIRDHVQAIDAIMRGGSTNANHTRPTADDVDDGNITE